MRFVRGPVGVGALRLDVLITEGINGLIDFQMPPQLNKMTLMQ
jgi:hypothetical protein